MIPVQELDYSKYDFKTEVRRVYEAPRGLSRRLIEDISEVKKEPDWMRRLRLAAFDEFQKRPVPTWGPDLSGLDFESMTYYQKPTAERATSWDDVPAGIKEVYEKLGIPEIEQKYLAGSVAQFESEGVYFALKKQWEEKGVIFCDMDTAVQKYPDVVRQYFMKAVPIFDNKFAALHASVWSGGSFAYIPPGVSVDMPLETYFRMNREAEGQFEHTMVIAEKGSEVQYIEGCLPAWEEVSTGNALVPITTVKEGDTVINSDGRETTVKATSVRQYEGVLVEITPVSAFNKFCLTTEHPVLAIPRRKVAWSTGKNKPRFTIQSKIDSAQPIFIEAGRLEIGDYLIFPINKVICDNPQFSNDLMTLLGYYLAEGSLARHKASRAVVFSLGEKEKGVIEEIKSACLTVFGKLPYEFHIPNKHGVQLRLHSKDFYALCETYCGIYSHGKRLSKAIMELPPEKQSYLLRAYYKGDGSVLSGSRRVVTASTVSKSLAFQLQELLARQGIYATVITSKARYTGFKNKNGEPILCAQSYIVRYEESRRTRTVMKRDGYFLVPIRKLSRIPYNGPVYNFEVSNQPNTYLVKGFAVHNCTAPRYSKDSLHSAVVEIYVKEGAKAKYVTVQNWSKNVFNLNTKRAIVEKDAQMSWIGGSLGSKVTMLYPCSVLKGENATATHLNIAFGSGGTWKDGGAKVIITAPNCKAKIVAKSISMDGGAGIYRGLVRINKGAKNAKVHVQCDALIMDGASRSDAYPHNEILEPTATVVHEASVGKINDEQLFYLMSRGLGESEARSMIVLGFLDDVLKEIPMQFAIEMNRFVQLEMGKYGAVG
jgi:Fe-S cluster assembly protein SufB